MSTSEAINELTTALAKAQGAIVNASKDRENTFFHGTYATLAAVWDACRAALSVNGLCVLQTTEVVPETETLRRRVTLVTTLAHSSGQWVRSEYPIVPVKDDPQGWGSATTYARRYALSAMVGVAPADDDDGEAAVGRGGNGFDKLAKKEPVPPKQQPKKVDPLRPKAVLPPLPDEITTIPGELLATMPQLGHLVAVPIRAQTLEDLELVVNTVQATRPKFQTAEGRSWLNAIEGAATYRIGEMTRP